MVSELNHKYLKSVKFGFVLNFSLLHKGSADSFLKLIHLRLYNITEGATARQFSKISVIFFQEHLLWTFPGGSVFAPKISQFSREVSFLFIEQIAIF